MIDSYISQDEFVLLIVLREYDDIKEEIKNLNTLTVHQRITIHYKTILSYCWKCRKNTESKNPNVAKTKKGRKVLSSKCAVCRSKISKFIKKQEAEGLLCIDW